MEEEDITDLFSNKYQNVYNSVPYNVEKMKSLTDEISHNIHNHTCAAHSIVIEDVLQCVSQLKQGKHDGNKGHFTNHLIHGTNRLYCYITMLFNCIISHGYVPTDMLLSTLIPIPKNKRKSPNCSDNYRAIALSSVMGKLLDHILLNKCSVC